MGGEDHVVSVTLLAHDVVSLAAISLLMFSKCDTIQSSRRSRQRRNGGSVVALTATGLAHLIFGLLRFAVKIKIIVMGPEPVTDAGLACFSESCGWLEQIGGIFGLLLLRGVDMGTSADSRGRSDVLLPFSH